jgi:hypothetical protein
MPGSNSERIAALEREIARLTSQFKPNDGNGEQAQYPVEQQVQSILERLNAHAGFNEGAGISTPHAFQDVGYDPIIFGGGGFNQNIFGQPTDQELFASGYVAVPAQAYYAQLGSSANATYPPWIGDSSAVGKTETWDSTKLVTYCHMANGTTDVFIRGDYAFIHYLGAFGFTPDYAPRQAGASKVIIEFTARWIDAAYGNYGIGATSEANPGDFSSTNSFIHVRPAGSGDISLITNDGGATGTTTTANNPIASFTIFHEYRIDWQVDQVVLYVDGTAIATNTTDLPAQSLRPLIVCTDDTNYIDIVDYSVKWA